MNSSGVGRYSVTELVRVRLLGVSLVVMEWQTFPGSRHLAEYCADSTSECSLIFSILVSACRWSISCDSQW